MDGEKAKKNLRDSVCSSAFKVKTSSMNFSSPIFFPRWLCSPVCVQNSHKHTSRRWCAGTARRLEESAGKNIVESSKNSPAVEWEVGCDFVVHRALRVPPCTHLNAAQHILEIIQFSFFIAFRKNNSAPLASVIFSTPFHRVDDTRDRC